MSRIVLRAEFSLIRKRYPTKEGEQSPFLISLPQLWRLLLPYSLATHGRQRPLSLVRQWAALPTPLSL
jgi:hypothetical protein